MLDMDYGFFPNVTRSHTTSKNAIEIIEKYVHDIYNCQTYYVTRAYQTRHGNGFLSNIDLDKSYIKINPLETNVDTGAQGVFRRSVLDLDQLKYAVSCDKNYNYFNGNLVITCMDHVGDKIPATKNGNSKYYMSMEIIAELKLNDLYTSNSDKGFLCF